MNIPQKFIKKTGFGADLAFAVVVLASYFATFSALTDANSLDVFMMVGLGITYIAIGIYGFAYCIRTNALPIQITYFIIQIPLGGLIVYLGKGAGFNAMVLLPLAGHSVLLLPVLWMYAANVGIALTYILAIFSFSSAWGDVWAGIPTFLAGQIFIIIFTQMAVNEERGQSEVERLVHELEEANQRLRDYALQVEELTITKERNRLAREIHDGLGHFLTTIHMQIQAARAVFDKDPKSGNEALSNALSMTQEALAEVRNSVAALRAPADENLPLVQRIDKLLKNCEVAGIESQFEILGNPHPLPTQTEWTIYRTAQESINNTCKHAQAAHIQLILDYTPKKEVRFFIKDDGIGAENYNGGFGLIGLEERVNLLDGEFKINTSPGNGFEIEIRLPE